MTAVIGSVSSLEGGWKALFVVGVFGVAVSALVAASRVALALLPDRIVRGRPESQAGGFTSGLLDMAAVEQQRKLRAGVQRISGEIAYGRKMLIEAQSRDMYWNPFSQHLLRDHWNNQSELLAEAAEAVAGYRAAEAAYHEFDRIGRIVDERMGPRPRPMSPAVLPEDRLDEAISTAEAAETALADALARLA